MNKRVEAFEDEKLRVIEKEIPKAPPKGMIVKIHYAGVCHSDIHMWMNKTIVGGKVVPYTSVVPTFKHPRVLGHEIAGEVYQLGDADCPDDPKFAIGEKVVVYPWRGCGTCNRCTKKRENLCPESLLHFIGGAKDGGYQAYLPIEARDLAHRVPDSIPMEVACLLPCSGLTTYNAACIAKQTITESHYLEGFARVLIVGAGGLGLWALQWAKVLYPENTKVFVADLTTEKLELAKKLGADGGVLLEKELSEEETQKRTKEVCGGELDVAFDYVGASSTPAAIQGSLRRGGFHATIGVGGASLTLSVVQFAIQSKTVCGVQTGNSTQLTEVLDLVGKKKVTAPPITKHKPEEAQSLLQQLHGGTLTGRAVLKFI